MGKSSQTTTSETKVPQWLDNAGQTNLQRADYRASTGYTPYYGADVAAYTPQQEASFQNTNSMADAFGLSSATSTGMPQSQTYAGGVQAYSSGPMYDQSLNTLKEKNPGQYNAIQSQFIDPQTGAQPTWAYGPNQGQSGQSQTVQQTSGNLGFSGGGGGGYTPSSSKGGGYVSIRDMIDGGGPGKSGSTFSGGLLSNSLNRVGVSPVGSSSKSTSSTSKSSSSSSSSSKKK